MGARMEEGSTIAERIQESGASRLLNYRAKTKRRGSANVSDARQSDVNNEDP
jgi:hypothetical protein